MLRIKFSGGRQFEPLLVLQVRDNDAFAGAFSPANRIKEIYKNGGVFGLLVKKHQQRQNNTTNQNFSVLQPLTTSLSKSRTNKNRTEPNNQ